MTQRQFSEKARYCLSNHELGMLHVGFALGNSSMRVSFGRLRDSIAGRSVATREKSRNRALT